MSAVAEKPRPAAKAREAASMKCTLNRGDLVRVLGHAAAVVERRNTIPVLANVLLEAAGETLRLTATDLDLQIALAVPAQVASEGATTVSASLLHGIVREFADGAQIELAVVEGRLQVNSGRSRYKLQTLPVDQFPVIKASEPYTSFEVPARELFRTFKRIDFAQSSETVVRGYLCGINVDVEDGKLVFAATDGNRLAFSTIPAPDDVEIRNGILPTKLVSTLGKLIAELDGNMRLSFDERRVTAEFGSTVLTSKLVDGTYPPWRRVLPREDGKRLRIDAEAFGSAVRRAAIIANERTRAVKIELSEDKITVTCTSPEHGVAVEEAPCSWSDGFMEIGFNSRFLLDALAVAGDGCVDISMFDAASPALISNPDDDTARWIVTPMRV